MHENNEKTVISFFFGFFISFVSSFSSNLLHIQFDCHKLLKIRIEAHRVETKKKTITTSTKKMRERCLHIRLHRIDSFYRGCSR